MDSKFQSSFIPKSAVMVDNPSRAKLGMFGSICFGVFIISLITVGGGFVYKKLLEKSISGLQVELAEAEAGIDMPAVETLLRFNKKVKALNQILGKHVAISGFFTELEKNTVSTVQFLDLDYEALANKPVSIRMRGVASGYSAIADQEAVFKKNPNIISVYFDGLSLNSKGGGVDFNLKSEIRSDIIKFKNTIPVTQTIKTPSPTASSSSVSSIDESEVEGVDDLNIPDFSNL